MTYRIEYPLQRRSTCARLRQDNRRSCWTPWTGSRLTSRLVETRNRKPMRPNPVAPWELRVGRPSGTL